MFINQRYCSFLNRCFISAIYLSVEEYSGKKTFKGGRVGIWVPAHLGLGEIDGLLVPPNKASNLLTDHMITG